MGGVDRLVGGKERTYLLRLVDLGSEIRRKGETMDQILCCTGCPNGK